MKEKLGVLNGKTILVTGGAGAIGSNLVKTLSGYKCKVIVIDDLSAGQKENMPDRNNIIFYKDTILNDKVLDQIFKKKIDYVFHLAAHFANQNSVEHPRLDLLTNVMGTLKLLEYANKNSVKQFIYASSSCVYGPTNEAMTEELITKLETPYAISKLTGEEYVHFFCRYHKLKTTVVRYFNAYGPGDPPGRYRNVIPNFFMLALHKKPLTVMGSGHETRDFTYMDDVVDGTLLTLTAKNAGGHIYNIGRGEETTIIRLARLINKIAGNPAGIKFIKKRKWDSIQRRLANIDKSRRALGYAPSIPLEEGLLKTWEWFRKKYG